MPFRHLKLHHQLHKLLQNCLFLIPEQFLSLIDIVYIGEFNFFEDTNAVYKDGSLFISNEQDNEDDLLDDVIHEIAHAIEKKYGQLIYSDGLIEREFLFKRKKLKQILDNQGYIVNKHDFLNIEYNKDFDLFLYREIGYDILDMLTVNLLINPYSATSLREYFATGVEEYYMGKRLYLKKICPYIYRNISNLHEDIITGEI